MRLMCLPGPIQIGQICQVFTDNLTILYVSLLWEVEGQKKVSCQGSSGGGGSFPPPPKKKEGRREGRGEGVRKMWSLREVILFTGSVREGEEKIIEERKRRNAICCTCRCHAPNKIF